MKWDWRKLVAIFFVVGMVAGFGGYYSGNWLLEKIRSDRLQENAATIQRALERYALDNAGSYPQKMQALIDEKYLPQWPDNPYSASGEPMLPIPAKSPAQHGDFVYMPFGPVILLSPLEEPVEPGGKAAAQLVADVSPPEEPVDEELPSEVDQYFLIIYGPGPGAQFTQYSQVQNSQLGAIDWDEVALLLTAAAPIGN